MSLSVDERVDAVPRLVSLSALAERLGISKQAVHKRVSKLVAAGRLQAVRRGREVLVDPDDYARAVASTADPAREMVNEAPAAADAPASFRDARTQRELVELELKRLQLQEREGRLRPVDEIEAATLEAGQAIAKRLDQLPTHADKLTALAHKKGAEGVKEYLITLARELREAIAADLASIPDHDAAAPAAEPETD